MRLESFFLFALFGFGSLIRIFYQIHPIDAEGHCDRGDLNIIFARIQRLLSYFLRLYHIFLVAEIVEPNLFALVYNII